MANSLDSLVSLTLNATITTAPGTIGSSMAALAKIYGTHFTQGTGAAQADLAWWQERTLAASTGESLDLSGVQTDPYGNVILFARLKVLAIAASAANTNNVVVGNAPSNGVAGLFGALTHTAIVRPGGFHAWGCGATDTTGYPITGGTADQLYILNGGSGTTVTYDVIAIGCSV